jgi:hypothetical protein
MSPPVAQESGVVPATAPIVTIEPEKKADEKAAKPQAKPQAKPDDMFGSIEEEMANLLGRPSGKPT